MYNHLSRNLPQSKELNTFLYFKVGGWVSVSKYVNVFTDMFKYV